MTPFTSSVLTVIIENSSLGVIHNLSAMNMFDIMDQLPIDKNLYRTVVPFVFFIIFLLIYKFHRIKYALGNKFMKNFTPQNSENKEFQLHFLFLGLIVLILELTFEFFKIRPKSMLVTNMTISFILIGIAYLSSKSDFVFRNIKKIFRVIFLLAFL